MISKGSFYSIVKRDGDYFLVIDNEPFYIETCGCKLEYDLIQLKSIDIYEGDSKKIGSLKSLPETMGIPYTLGLNTITINEKDKYFEWMWMEEDTDIEKKDQYITIRLYFESFKKEVK